MTNDDNTPAPSETSTLPEAPPTAPAAERPPELETFRPTLAELDEIIRRPFFANIPVFQDGERKIAQIECREMTPAEAEKVAAIIRAVKPRVESVAGKDGIPRHQFRTDDPEYQSRKTQAMLDARAMALYLSVPMIREAKPGLTDIAAIRQLVDGVLTDQILAALWEAVVPSAPSVNEEAVNFI